MTRNQKGAVHLVNRSTRSFAYFGFDFWKKIPSIFRNFSDNVTYLKRSGSKRRKGNSGVCGPCFFVSGDSRNFTSSTTTTTTTTHWHSTESQTPSNMQILILILKPKTKIVAATEVRCVHSTCHRPTGGASCNSGRWSRRAKLLKREIRCPVTCTQQVSAPFSCACRLLPPFAWDFVFVHLPKACRTGTCPKANSGTKRSHWPQPVGGFLDHVFTHVTAPKSFFLEFF